MDVGTVRNQLQGLADRMGLRLPAVEPNRIPYNKDFPGEADEQIQRMQESFQRFAEMDNQTFNGHPDLDATPGRIKHQYGGPAHTAEYTLADDGNEMNYLECNDSRAVVAEKVEHSGNEWNRYLLVDDRGRLRADVVTVVDGPQQSYTCEQWYFSGPGVRPLAD